MPPSELIISQMAREIARELSPIEMICEKFRIDDDQYQAILRSPIFQRRLEEELAIWNASDPLSIAERIKAKAGTMIEESLLEVYALIHDRDQPMASKIRALEWASTLAGVGFKPGAEALPGAASTGSGINFNIFIGGEKQSFAVSADQPKLVEGEVILSEVKDA